MMVPIIGQTKKREVIEWPASLMARVIEFASIAGVQKMGLHCALCSQDFVASNDQHAPVYTMKCGCREFWSTNPATTGRTH